MVLQLDQGVGRTVSVTGVASFLALQTLEALHLALGDIVVARLGPTAILEMHALDFSSMQIKYGRGPFSRVNTTQLTKALALALQDVKLETDATTGENVVVQPLTVTISLNSTKLSPPMTKCKIVKSSGARLSVFSFSLDF